MCRGERVLVRTPGGGGYGPIAQHDPDVVERDRRMGYVSGKQRAGGSARRAPQT
jgi:N-methylhydantoinase B/oxoprolinase/acetone carboxylase alpha subunit